MTGDSLVDSLIAEGLSHHREGRREKALELYQAVLKAVPEYPDALSLAGTALLELERREEARGYLETALRRAPRNPEIHNNYGNLLTAEGQLPKARRHYNKALNLRPGYGEAWRNLARLHTKDCSREEGLQSFHQAVMRRRKDAEGHFTLASLLQHHNALEAAVECLEAAIAADPRHVDAHYQLSIVLHCLDRSEEGVTALYKVLELDPEHGRAKHMRDAMEGRPSSHAPDSYVATLFDAYAPRYDKHLVETLQYRGPELIRTAILAAGETRRFERALDIGCGTGLVGEAVADLTGRLEGVDLSAKMIAKAEETGVYGQLYRADIVAHLSPARPSKSRFDLVVSGDVLVYIGDLDPLFAKLTPIMPPAGLFVFTVEEKLDEGHGFALRETGRYVHRPDYIEGVAAAHGFEVLSLDSRVVRYQKKQPVQGLVVALRRTDAAP